MRVVDIRIAVVVVDGDLLRIVLEDVACVCCITAAGKVGYMAACKAARDFLSVLLVGPGGTICQPQVKCTITGGVITRRHFVEAAAVPAAVFALQCQINGRRCRSCFLLPIIIGFCRLGVDIAIDLHDACDFLAVFHIDVDHAIVVRLQRNVIRCLAILLDSQVAAHGNSTAVTAVNTIAFCLRSGRNSGVCINGDLTACCINSLRPEACGIRTELQALSCNAHILRFPIAETGSDRTCHIAALQNMVGYVQILSVGMNRNRSATGFNSTQVRAVITLCDIDHCILREVVNAFFGFDAQIYILLIQITCDRISNNGIILGRILIEALTRSLRAGCIGGEADSAGLERFGGSGQSFSNLDRTSQLAVICGVEELLCQLVQNFINSILVFSLILCGKAFRDALVIRDERNGRPVLHLTDSEATAENIGRMSSIMAVNHGGIATVITYADVACIACHKDAAFITGEGSQLAGTIYIPDRVIQLQVHRIAAARAGPGCMIQISVYGVAGKVIAGPRCITSHVKVHDTCIAAVSIAYIALPEGVLRIQTEADICLGAGIIHAAAEIDISFQLNSIAACTDDSAFGILLDIHIHLSAVLGSEFTISTNRIFSSVDRLDNAAANLNLGGNCTDGFVSTGSIALLR